jgi:hypothetical protein
MTVCTWAIDPGCCSDWSTYDPDSQARAAAFATDVLWAATGRQFGACPITVRPCFNKGFSNFGYWFDGGWMPFIWNGQWYNSPLGCGCSGFCCCGTRPFTEVWLPGPVAGISQVVVGGLIVDPSAYRVDDAQWLVRQDGNTWPVLQDYNVAAGSLNSWEVTLFRGTPVPPSLSTAAGVLACEFLKACAGGECRLPGYVQSIIRTGVEVQMVSLADALKLGFTGLAEVDMVIRSFNPNGLTHRLRLYSPDTQVNRITTTS